MANHRAPRTPRRRLRRATRYVVCLPWRAVKLVSRAVRAVALLLWHILRTLLWLALAAVWLAAAATLWLAGLSLGGSRGTWLRRVVRTDMVRPMGDGAREAVAERRPGAHRAPTPAVLPVRAPSTLARDTDPMPGDDDAWPTMGPLWTAEDLAAAEPITMRAIRRLQPA